MTNAGQAKQDEVDAAVAAALRNQPPRGGIGVGILIGDQFGQPSPMVMIDPATAPPVGYHVIAPESAESTNAPADSAASQAPAIGEEAPVFKDRHTKDLAALARFAQDSGYVPERVIARIVVDRARRGLGSLKPAELADQVAAILARQRALTFVSQAAGDALAGNRSGLEQEHAAGETLLELVEVKGGRR